MRIFLASFAKCGNIRHGLVGQRLLAARLGVLVGRNLSQDFTHDYEDDHPESDEILTKLRQKHHYHGLTEKQKNIHNVMVIEPDFKWGRNR